MSWYEKSLSVINKVIKEKGREKVTKKDIDSSYPFGERKYYPYKAWLKARKEKFIELGFIKSENKIDGLFKEE